MPKGIGYGDKMSDKKKKKKKNPLADFLRKFSPDRATNENADKLLKRIDEETLYSGVKVRSPKMKSSSSRGYRERT